MKLQKAIEILEHIEGYTTYPFREDVKAAAQLGTEALKFRLELEQTDPEITLEPLLGQTEE